MLFFWKWAYLCIMKRLSLILTLLGKCIILRAFTVSSFLRIISWESQLVLLMRLLPDHHLFYLVVQMALRWLFFTLMILNTNNWTITHIVKHTAQIWHIRTWIQCLKKRWLICEVAIFLLALSIYSNLLLWFEVVWLKIWSTLILIAKILSWLLKCLLCLWHFLVLLFRRRHLRSTLFKFLFEWFNFKLHTLVFLLQIFYLSTPWLFLDYLILRFFKLVCYNNLKNVR